MKGQIIVCPVTLRRKEIQEWGREYWWVSRSLTTARKIALVLWVRTWKKTAANDRAGIKHLTLKFRGPVGLGGVNKSWKNELLKEHWPKSWMCSSHVVMVCYCCWNRQEESVKKRVGLFCSKNMWGREDERMLHRLLYCPGKSSGQNGMNHSHWTKYINWNPNGKTIPAQNNNVKFFLSATAVPWKSKLPYLRLRKLTYRCFLY